VAGAALDGAAVAGAGCDTVRVTVVTHVFPTSFAGAGQGAHLTTGPGRTTCAFG
jgi:hypothetical protein